MRLPKDSITLAGVITIRSSISMPNNHSDITRQQFMAFFRDDEMLNQLTTDDRMEIFSQVLTGSSDITKARLDDLIRDYSVAGF